VDREPAALHGLTVVGAHDGLDRFSGRLKVVVGDLGRDEQRQGNMCACMSVCMHAFVWECD